jgi:uncharacterized protein
MNSLKPQTIVLWKNNVSDSIEYSKLSPQADSYALQGTIIMLLEQTPTKITYRVSCDKCWRTRHVWVCQERLGERRQLTLKVDKNQRWLGDGVLVPFATGLFDVDFEVSPATNTLPLRRLDLKIGESTEFDAVWVRFPRLKLEPLSQRYTRLSDRCYKYEASALGYEALLEVDGDGLIVKYDELWTRVT